MSSNNNSFGDDFYDYSYASDESYGGGGLVHRITSAIKTHWIVILVALGAILAIAFIFKRSHDKEDDYEDDYENDYDQDDEDSDEDDEDSDDDEEDSDEDDEMEFGAFGSEPFVDGSVTFPQPSLDEDSGLAKI